MKEWMKDLIREKPKVEKMKEMAEQFLEISDLCVKAFHLCMLYPCFSKNGTSYYSKSGIDYLEELQSREKQAEEMLQSIKSMISEFEKMEEGEKDEPAGIPKP